MGGLAAQYVDGALQTSTASSESLATKSNNSTISSDTFLALLVAEMENQDPLEPTSNTEWVSQYATFTQVEQVKEMGETLEVMRANTLVGKEVIMKVQNATTGDISYTRGVVDYITMEEGKALLNIGGSSYSLSDLDTVATTDYFEAYDLYTEFANKVGALPASTSGLSAQYENAMKELYNMYENMTDYQKGFVSTYAADELTYYKAALDVMKDYGIDFSQQKEQETSLDDLLNAFNSKMESLMTQVSELTEKVSLLENASENS